MADQGALIGFGHRGGQCVGVRDGLILQEDMFENVMRDIALGHDVQFLGRPGHVLGSDLAQKPGEWADEQRFQP